MWSHEVTDVVEHHFNRRFYITLFDEEVVEPTVLPSLSADETMKKRKLTMVNFLKGSSQNRVLKCNTEHFCLSNKRKCF